MILVLLNQAMALGHDYRALTLDDCLALAREQNPVLTASREKVQELVVAKANSQSLQLLEKKRDRLNGIKVDLTAAWKDQENARQGVATTRQTVTTNEEAYASADAHYRHGKAIGLDALQAQVDLTGSRFNLIRYGNGLHLLSHPRRGKDF